MATAAALQPPLASKIRRLILERDEVGRLGLRILTRKLSFALHGARVAISISLSEMVWDSNKATNPTPVFPVKSAFRRKSKKKVSKFRVWLFLLQGSLGFFWFLVPAVEFWLGIWVTVSNRKFVKRMEKDGVSQWYLRHLANWNSGANPDSSSGTLKTKPHENVYSKKTAKCPEYWWLMFRYV